MERHPNDLATDAGIDAAFERAKAFDTFPTIVKAEYLADTKLQCLVLRLSNNQRLLIPREMLDELKHASTEQAADLSIVMLGLAVWWPQLDDGLYLPDFLEHRWKQAWPSLAAEHLPCSPAHILVRARL